MFYIPVPTGTYQNITAQIKNGNNLIASKEWENQTVGLGTLKKGIITHTSKMKKLISIKEESESGSLTFEYNANGELIKDNGWGDDNNIYTWNANTITMSENNGNYIFTLKNALLSKYTEAGKSHSCTYEYNSSNKLIKFCDNVEIEWDDNKIVSYKRSSDDWAENYTITYGNDITAGWCPIYDDELWDELDYFHWANPHLSGMLNHSLPTKIEGAGDICYFSYDLDNDGYVSKVYVERSSTSSPNQIEWTKTYIYTWQ